MNWKLAIVIWALVFILRVLPVMATIGNLLMSPFKPRNKQATSQSLLIAFKRLTAATIELVNANEVSLEEQASELVILMEEARN